MKGNIEEEQRNMIRKRRNKIRIRKKAIGVAVVRRQ
jgi:hypothetical protein